MTDSVKDRVILFIDYKGISKHAFEKACGLSTRYVSNMRQSIQPDKIKKIALAFPELNTGWLLTGEGEMIKSTTSKLKEDVAVASPQEMLAENKTVANNSLIDYLQKKIEELEKEKADLLQENAILKYENKILSPNKGESAGIAVPSLSADAV